MVISWLPRWLELGLALFAAWMVAGVFMHDDWSSQQSNAYVTIPEQENKDSAISEQTIQQVPLFGQALVKLPEKEKPVAVTASKLNIKLIGTVVAGEKSAAMLLINGSKEHKVFFLHEEIQPAVRLSSVEAAEIVVDNRGKMERIAIEAGAVLATEPANMTRAPAPHRRVKLPQQSRNIEKGHLQKQLRNFSTLLSQARVSPHFTNKQADGFTISEIVKGSLYEEIGLQNGDVIQKVNGESVTSAEQAMRMYRELQNSTFIDVEISRGGSVQQVSYTIQ